MKMYLYKASTCLDISLVFNVCKPLMKQKKRKLNLKNVNAVSIILITYNGCCAKMGWQNEMVIEQFYIYCMRMLYICVNKLFNGLVIILFYFTLVIFLFLKLKQVFGSIMNDLYPFNYCNFVQKSS